MAKTPNLMLSCPACGERGISPWDKVFNSPWRGIYCAHCGQRCMLHWLAVLIWLFLTPVLIIVVFSVGIAVRNLFGGIVAAILLAPLLMIPALFPLRIRDR